MKSFLVEVRYECCDDQEIFIDENHYACFANFRRFTKRNKSRITKNTQIKVKDFIAKNIFICLYLFLHSFLIAVF